MNQECIVIFLNSGQPDCYPLQQFFEEQRQKFLELSTKTTLRPTTRPTPTTSTTTVTTTTSTTSIDEIKIVDRTDEVLDKT